MIVSHTIPTSAGPRRLPGTPMRTVRLTATELHLLVRALEAAADTATAEGRFDAGDTLAWRAAALKEAACIRPLQLHPDHHALAARRFGAEVAR